MPYPDRIPDPAEDALKELHLATVGTMSRMLTSRRRSMFRRCVVLAFLVLSQVSLASLPEARAQEAGPSGVHTVYLIRHGQHEDTGTADPFLGSGLSALGAEQAAMVAGRLRSMGVSFDTLAVSPMTRAVDTATPIADSLGMTPVLVQELAECTPPTWREDVMAELGPGEADSCRAALDAVFARFFQATPERDSRLILVCHGNVTRYLVCRALRVDTMAWLGMMVRHASITEIQVRPDGSCRVAAYGDAGFQPPAKQSFQNIDRKE
jgi:serine/threonine-protein phosphatase PGAM5